MKPGYTYILGSLTGVLYIGVTSKLGLRIFQHKSGIFEGFSKTYNCSRLLHFERYEDIRNAIAREKQLKGWRREKKLNLIRTTNPDFKDLAEPWGSKLITRHERIEDSD
ncbi:MAG TPA: GIY-YIG nuclease family protein [Acidobacteriaceae bacterium]|nr:GIY-YIG nuclease family protein [Acidobacteriaceae bacterium]